MNHLTEEDLIAHVYAEGEEQQVERHLDACAECAKNYTVLCRDLIAMKWAETPERDQLYGERVWESIAGQLPACQARKRSWLRGRWVRGLSYAVACAALIIFAFIGGRHWERRQAKTVAATHPQKSIAPPPQRVVVVVLSDHLDRSERLLVELKHADADSAKMVSPLRDEARSLLAANRICRQNAKQENDPALSTALDRLDHLLTELANQPGGLDREAIIKLQDEMNADGLLFEVRVLRLRQAASTAQKKGNTI
jgi:hypothetical protein